MKIMKDNGVSNFAAKRIYKVLARMLITAVSLSLLANCGGCLLSNCGSDAPSNDDNTLPNASVVDNGIIQANEAIELVLNVPNQTVSNISWQQNSGPSVTFLANTSKVIAFTAPTAGQYQFSVSYDVAGLARQTQDYSVEVTSARNLLNVRLGHAVIEGNKVSLRAEVSASLNENNLTWQQILGPKVQVTDNDTDGKLAIFFDAPEVEQDTELRFQVTLSQNGTTHTDVVSVLVENASSIKTDAYFEETIASVFPYKASSPYADSLVNCVYSNQFTDSCALGTLPLIAQDTTNPTVDDIMDRVVVSHAWMGERFQEFLENNDTNNDFKNLLRATTAIVISYDVRPSFYWAVTGAIYLDASNLWLTADERDTINEAPDYRSDFGNDLTFVMPWRFVKDNDYANSFVADDERTSRTQADGLPRLTSLLYHELAHANDFFPSNEWLSHSSNTSILAAALATDFESDQLALTYPLNSSEMYALAQVSFHGESANDTQKNYQPSDIEAFFSPEHASDFYNFSSLREDYAMLFEELMMQSRYGIIRDVAITNQPTGDNVSSRDYIVTWGQRGRIAEANIKPRVLFVAERILPEFDSAAAIASLPEPIAMIEGNDWLDNLEISPISSSKASAEKAAKSADEHNLNHNERPVNWLRYAQPELPQP